MKTVMMEIKCDVDCPDVVSDIERALRKMYQSPIAVRELPAQMEGEENDATKAFRRALEEIKTGLKNAGFKKTVTEIQALLDDYPVIQQPIPAQPEQGQG
jgi:hypothetical protein